jgi:TetR/AcrR family transcriptional repressor of mexJK operon
MQVSKVSADWAARAKLARGVRSRGPTRAESRRAALLTAATETFLEHGFAGATLEQVIAKAGGSRATLYAQFGNKEGLFAAIISDVCDRMVAALDAAVEGGRPPAQVLRAFGVRFATAFLEPASIALFRVAAADSGRFPELGRRVFAAGPVAAAARLADYLAGAKRRGELKMRDPALAARIFLEMITGDLHKRALFGVPPAPTLGEIEETVGAAVKIFLTGCAPPQEASVTRRP